MSQWGAEGYALHGAGYRGILAHYYPHTTLGTITDEPVRVGLAVDRPRVHVGSAAPFLLVDARGRKVHVPAGTLGFGRPLRLGKHALAPPLTVEPGAQPLTLDGAGYRGELTLVRAGGGLTVVNTLSLELYLRAVVPSEMPRGWLAAAYEAQAVAARSYAFATRDAAGPFDFYADSRSQVYGGIAAETPATNDAVAETAGQVLSYDDRVIAAYYDSDAGGRTAAVEDVFAGSRPVPYLVSVSDPYDSRSPYRHWRRTLSAQELAARFGVDVDDVRVAHAPSGVAAHVSLLGRATRTLVSARDFSSKLGLRSLRFSVCVLSLEAPAKTRPGRPLLLRGFLRDIGGVVLQQQTAAGGWRQVAHVRARPDGRFAVTVRPRSATAYRLAVDEVAGPPVTAGSRR
jgi:SpoIID/LytB domain protein